MTDKIDLFEEVTIRCESAEEFLQELDETHERWGTGSFWVYRGQNDATWELMPSLFRDWQEGTRASYEFELIRLFVQNANFANLPIPSNTLGYASRVKEKAGILTQLAIHDFFDDAFVYDFTHVVFAIAQHSGVPTRLLDFTHDPLVAAFFASEPMNLYHNLKLSADWKKTYFTDILFAYQRSIPEAIEKLDEYLHFVGRAEASVPDSIAVWAVRTHDLHSNTTLRVLDHPYTEILNLNSQKGIFICNTDRYELRGEPWRSFDSELAKLIETSGVFKITLPFARWKDLRSLLVKKRYFTEVLSPSYQLVASAALSAAQKYRYVHGNSCASQSDARSPL